MAKKDLPVFDTSNDLHRATGYDHQSLYPDFDIFTLESLEPTCTRCMPPYRQNFYQIGILSHTGESHINLNTNAVDLRAHPLWFVVPGQIFSWVRDPATKGFHIQFKREFLDHIIPNLTAEFPFLKITENSVFQMTDAEQISLQTDMARMLSLITQPNPYKRKMLENLLIAVLYNCKSVYDQFKTTEGQLSRSQLLTQQFQQLVNKLYLDTKNVGDYAAQLNVTPNHLTTVVKQVTGKTAKDIIQSRLFLESKNLLTYSNLDIAEVAYQLNFDEPSHFSRFFKKYSGTTPNRFRRS